MNKKGLRDTFCRLSNIKSKSLSNYYCDCFIESLRLGLVEDGELFLPKMFKIKVSKVPPGVRKIYNPSNGTYGTRKEHYYLRISENGDRLQKSDFQIKYRVEDTDDE